MQNLPFLGWQRRSAATWRSLTTPTTASAVDAPFADDGVDDRGATRALASARDVVDLMRARYCADSARQVDVFVCGSLYVVGAMLRVVGARVDEI